MLPYLLSDVCSLCITRGSI